MVGIPCVILRLVGGEVVVMSHVGLAQFVAEDLYSVGEIFAVGSHTEETEGATFDFVGEGCGDVKLVGLCG